MLTLASLAALSGGTLAAAVTGTGPSYNVAVTGMTGNGLVAVSVIPGAATDAVTGTLTPGSTTAYVMFSTSQPTVLIGQAAAQADPTGFAPINFSVVFSKPVTGFSGSGVNFTGSTVGGTLAAAVTGSGTTYNVAVTGMTGTGTVVANVSAGAAIDVAGNSNVASVVSIATITFGSAGTYLTYGAKANSTLVAPASIANGDLLIAYLVVGLSGAAPPTPVAPAGWSELTGSPLSDNASGFQVQYHVYYKIAASEAGNYTFTHASASTCGVVMRYVGVDTSTPFSPTPTSNTGTGVTATATGFTTVAANTFVIFTEHDFGDNTNDTVVPVGSTPTFTERTDTVLLYIADGTLAAAGATGNKSHTCNNVAGSSWGAYLIGLKPGAIAGSDNSVTYDATSASRTVDGGATYYATKGFANAATMGFDTTFIPMGPFDAKYGNALLANSVAAWSRAGWNCGMSPFNTSDWDRPTMIANNIAALETSGGPIGPNTIGYFTVDEPVNWTDASGPIASTANALQDGRFWYMNNTHMWLRGQGLSGSPAPSTPTSNLAELIVTPNATTRHFDINSVDIYWNSASRDSSWSGFLLDFPGGAGPTIYGLNRAMTLDEAQRGSNYGDQIDIIRGYQTGHFPAPVFNLIETGDPFSADPGDGSCYIKAKEITWAFWSSFIHGARGIVWFDHSFSGPGTSSDGLSSTYPSGYYYQVHAGDTISVADAIRNACTLATNLAPIINSNFAIGYVTTNRGGYTFPIATLSLANGVEIMAKRYTGTTFSNASGTFAAGFYIFACIRGSGAQTNVSVTFTIPAGATTATVIGEGRSIPITSGVFTDTFATAYVTHIYQIT